MLRLEPLYRDDAVEPRIARFPHLAHPTRADGRQKQVRAQLDSGSPHGHRLPILAILNVMNWTATAAIMLALAVSIGAFGAHGLQARLDPYSLGVYEKAVT